MIELFFPNPQDLLPLRTGPLAPYLGSFASQLARQGYCRAEGRWKIRLVAGLSRWLAQRQIELQQLDETQTAAFLESRWQTHSKKGGEQRTLKMSRLFWNTKNRDRRVRDDSAERGLQGG